MLCLQLTASLYTIPDSNIVQRQSIDFSNPLNAWLLVFDAVPVHNLVFVQVCTEEHMCGLLQENASPHAPIVACAQLNNMLQEQHWSLADTGTSASCLSAAAVNTELDHLFTTVYPDQIKIHNDMDTLRRYGSFANETLTLGVRVLFAEDHADGWFSVHIYSEVLRLKVPTLLYGTLKISHECPNRGLHTPPGSTLHLQQWKNTSITNAAHMPCMWECNPSHVRHPFNSFPPLKTTAAANLSRYVCQQLPADFTSAQLKFSVYLQGNHIENGEYSPAFFAAIDELADNMQSKAQADFDGEVLVILMVADTIFSSRAKNDIGRLLLEHVVHSERFAHYQDLELIASRRLLQAEVDVSGVMVVADPGLTDLDFFRRTVSTSADTSLQEFIWPPKAGVQSTDPNVVLTHLQRAYKPPPPAESFVNDAFFVYVLLGCAGSIVVKKLYSRAQAQVHYKA